MNTKQLLDQDRIWQTRDGMPIPLERMDPGHRAATLAFLRRRAAYLASAYAFCELKDTFLNAARGADADMEQLADLMAHNERAIGDGAADWLERRPLIVALARLVANDQRGPVVDGEVVTRALP